MDGVSRGLCRQQHSRRRNSLVPRTKAANDLRFRPLHAINVSFGLLMELTSLAHAFERGRQLKVALDRLLFRTSMFLDSSNAIRSSYTSASRDKTCRLIFVLHALAIL